MFQHFKRFSNTQAIKMAFINLREKNDWPGFNDSVKYSHLGSVKMFTTVENICLAKTGTAGPVARLRQPC